MWFEIKFTGNVCPKGEYFLGPQLSEVRIMEAGDIQEAIGRTKTLARRLLKDKQNEWAWSLGENGGRAGTTPKPVEDIKWEWLIEVYYAKVWQGPEPVPMSGKE